MASQSAAGTISYGTVTVGTSATAIRVAKGTRNSIVIQNVHASNDLYIGGDDQVATTTGLKIIAGDSIKLDDFNGPVYGIASAASTDVRYFEVG